MELLALKQLDPLNSSTIKSLLLASSAGSELDTSPTDTNRELPSRGLFDEGIKVSLNSKDDQRLRLATSGTFTEQQFKLMGNETLKRFRRMA